MSNLYISYVSRDKEFVQRLMDSLNQKGVQTIDGRLGLGDSLSASIRKGLQQASFALLVLSRSFFDKSWPRFEFEEVDKLDREFGGGTKLLPVWHEIDRQTISYFAPELAQRLGVSSQFGIKEIVEQIMDVVAASESEGSSANSIDIGQTIASQKIFPTQKSIPSSQNILLTLRHNLNAYFNSSELMSLCFDLGIDIEELGGSNKSDTVRNLISMMQRHGRLEELVELVRQQRPHASW